MGKTKVKVTSNNKGRGRKPIKIGLQPQMSIRIKIDSNGKPRKKGW